MTRIVGRDRIQRGTLVLAIAGAYAFLSLLTDGLVVVPRFGTVRLAAGLAVPLALLVGPVACWGVGVGVVLTDLFRFALTWETAVVAVSQFLLGYLAFRTWGSIPAVSTGDRPTMRSPRQALEFLAVALLAAITATAFLGWGLEILGNRPFYLTTLLVLPAYVGATVILGLPLIYALSGRIGDLRETYRDRTPVEIRSWSFAGAFLVPVLWLGLGTVGSLGFRLAQRVDPRTFVRRDVEYLLHVVNPGVFGHGASRVLILYGAIMLSLVVATVSETKRHK